MRVVYNIYSLEREKGRDVIKKMRNRMMGLIEDDLRRRVYVPGPSCMSFLGALMVRPDLLCGIKYYISP